MGTKVHRKSFLPGYYTMRDLNENCSSWPIFYTDKNVPNAHDYNGFIPGNVINDYPWHDKDSWKHKILEHEAVFKNQVYELHRLYRIQRDMMEEIKRKEVHKHRISSMEPSLSSSNLQDARKWYMAGFPLSNSAYSSSSFPGVEIVNSPSSCTKGYNNSQPYQFPFPNGSDSRPSKVRKKLFNFELPADEYIDNKEGEKNDSWKIASASGSTLRGPIRLADLNEPIGAQEGMVHFLGDTSTPVESKSINQCVKPNGGYLGKSNLDLYNSSPGSYPFFSSSFANSRAYPVSSWAKPSSFTHKINSFESSLNSVAAMDRSLEVNGNGFYHGSASESKELQVHSPSASFDYLRSRTNHGFGNFPKGPSHVDSKPVIDINLNEVQDSNMIDEKAEDHLLTLPWLKVKPARDRPRDLNQLFSSDSGKNEIPESQNVQKILGVPIFKAVALKNEPLSLDSPPFKGKNVINEGKNRMMIDINLASQPDEQITAEEEHLVESEMPKKGNIIRHYIDLNSCVSDTEDPPASSNAIDLESPVHLESNKSELDEVARYAAETIFSISSSYKPIETVDSISQVSLEESLLSFADACAQELEGKEFDDFEAMTLQLEETKEEDYTPQPFIPENKIAGPGMSNRSRRGPTRRGRQQRKDFQRDILPGLTSLSRHEVSEDIQTFGGVMRAARHSWNSRNETRNGGARGRRRAIVENAIAPILSPVCTSLVKGLDNSIESSLEDRRLMGWGKTTRRPRRQRCAAGNPTRLQ